MRTKVQRLEFLIRNPFSLYKLLSGFVVQCFYILKWLPSIREFKNRSNIFICFDYGHGIYADFYINLYNQLRANHTKKLKILASFDIIKPIWHFDRRFRRVDFLPAYFTKYIKNCIVISATEIDPQKRTNHHIFVQIFHGFASIGSGFGENYIKGFDKVFLTTPYQYQQLTEGAYKNLTAPDALVKVGYIKIDKFIKIESRRSESSRKTIFYGPTYHREISSIFNFFDGLIEFADRRGFQLIVKLHPLLLMKYDFDKSGGIDWENRISKLANIHKSITLLPTNLPFEDVKDYFYKSDFFITDTSGLGYEYALITGRPVVFLGKNLKIPLEDLRAKNNDKFAQFPEVKCRGVIGPVIENHNLLSEKLDSFLSNYHHFSDKNKEFREKFTFNLGTATKIASSEVIKLVDKLKKTE